MMITKEQLSYRYRRGQRSNVPRLYVATIISFLIPIFILIGRPVFLLYQSMQPGLKYPEPLQSIYLHANMISGLLLIGIAMYWFLQWMKFGEVGISGSTPLKLSILPGLEPFLAEAQKKLHITKSITISATASGLATAGAIKGTPVVGISPYFSALYKDDPDTARFVLAHELSHIAQGDTSLLARLDWLALFTRQLLYWYFIVQAIFLIVGYLGLGMVLNAVQGENGAHLYKDVLFYAFIQAVFLIVLFSIGRAGLLLVRKLRHTSEFLADLGGATVVNPDHFALWLGQRGQTGQISLRSTHPSDDARIKRLRNDAAAWGTDINSIPLPPTSQQDLLKRKLQAGPMVRMLVGALLIYGYLGNAVTTIGTSTQFNIGSGILGGLVALLAVAKFARAYAHDGPELPHGTHIKTFSLRALIILAGGAALISLPLAWSNWNYLHRSTATPINFTMLRNGEVHNGDWVRITAIEIDTQQNTPRIFRLLAPEDPLYIMWKSLNEQVQTLPSVRHSTYSQMDPGEIEILERLDKPEEQARIKHIGQNLASFDETKASFQLLETSDLLQFESYNTQSEQPTFSMPDFNIHGLEDEAMLRLSGVDPASIKSMETGLKALQAQSGMKAQFANLMRPNVNRTGTFIVLPDELRTSFLKAGKPVPLGILNPSASPYPSPRSVFVCDIFFAAVLVCVGCLIWSVKNRSKLNAIS